MPDENPENSPLPAPDLPPARRPIHRWRRRANWFYAAAVVLLLVGSSFYLVLGIRGAREAARRSNCKGHLKQIGLALLNYHETYGCFPPAYVADENGRPMHSWRVLILPFADNGQIYNKYRFDEPWDGAHNRLLLSQLGSSHGTIYHCPSDLHDGTRDELLTTSYLAVIGPETAWNGSRSAKLEEITDGAADTILIVEVVNSGIPWMEPRDLHVMQMPTTVNARAGMGISSAHPGGANIMTVDDSIRWLPNSIPATSVRGMLTIRGGEKP